MEKYERAERLHTIHTCIIDTSHCIQAAVSTLITLAVYSERDVEDTNSILCKGEACRGKKMYSENAARLGMDSRFWKLQRKRLRERDTREKETKKENQWKKRTEGYGKKWYKKETAWQKQVA